MRFRHFPSVLANGIGLCAREINIVRLATNLINKNNSAQFTGGPEWEAWESLLSIFLFPFIFHQKTELERPLSGPTLGSPHH